MINISGAIGVSILEKENKKVIVFSDNHASDNYCYKDSLKISKFLEKKAEKHIVLLEEVPRLYRNGISQIFFAEHTELLKELSINNKKIISVDIRPLLLEFSWELITVKTKDKYNQTLEEYLKNIIKFLDYKIDDEELRDYFEEIKNKINDFLETNKEHLLSLLVDINDFLETNKEHLLSLLVDIVLEEIINLEPINDIVIDIMDFNIIRIILKLIKDINNKHIYLHAGLYHTQNINKRLLTMGFEKMYQYGAVSLNITNINNIINNSCIKLGLH